MIAFPQVDHPNYAAMSKDDLIDIIKTQKQVIGRFYSIRRLSNKKLAPGEKWAILAAIPRLEQEKPNDEGLVRLPIGDIAEEIGMSDTTASRYFINMCKRYDATHVEQEYTTKKGQKCILIYVDPTDDLWTRVETIELDDEKLRTINGNECPRCHSTGTYRTKKRPLTYQEIGHCDACNLHTVSNILKANDPLDPMCTLPPKKGLQAEEPFGEKDIQPEEPFLEAQKNDALTSINNHTSIGEYPLNGFSLESWLEQRIGHGRIIKSTGNLEKAKKYFTEDEGYEPDIEAYLRGDLRHIYGSRPALPDGTTYVLGFDCDTPELDGQHSEWMKQLAAGGLSSVYWKRRPGRGHFEIYIGVPVDRRAAYAYVLKLCPGLAAVPEVFPIGKDQNTGGSDRADYGYSWPLYYRIGNVVTECEAEILTPLDLMPMKSTGIQSDRARLTWLLSQAITDAALIPALPQNEVAQEPARPGGALLDKTPGVLPTRNYPNDVAKIAIAERKAALTWEEVAAPVGGLHGDRFYSPLHKEDTPSVVIRGEYASDYGRTPSGKVETLDKFDWYCLVRGIDRKEEKNRIIQAYRQQQELVTA